MQLADLQSADRNLVEDEQRHRCGLSSVHRSSDVQRVAGESLVGHRSLAVSYFVYISLAGRERTRTRDRNRKIYFTRIVV